MKLKINTEVIKALKPCENRFNNWLYYYEYRDFTLRQFLGLNKITHTDKLWVVLRLVDNDTKIIFALDCAFSAAAISWVSACDVYVNSACVAAFSGAFTNSIDSGSDSDSAYDVASYTSCYAAGTKKSYKTELARQLESLIYLIEGNES